MSVNFTVGTSKHGVLIIYVEIEVNCVKIWGISKNSIPRILGK